MSSPSSALASRPWLALAIPLALCALAYGRVLDAPFVYDDLGSVLRNPEVHTLGGQPGRLVAGWLRGGRPVTDLSFALNYAVGGLVPWNFHLTSLAVHLAVTVLAWAFAREALRLAGAARGDAVAVLVAGLFALHPVQAEAVAYVAQRSEALAAGLSLAALLLLLAAERRGLGRRALPWLGGALACFALALGAKATAVMLPVAWPLTVMALPGAAGRGALAGWRRRAVALAPFALLDLLFMVRTLGSLAGKSDAGFEVPGLPPATYLVAQLQVVATYLRLLAWPAGLNVDWDYRAARSLGAPEALLSGALLVACGVGALALCLRARRREGEGAASARVAGFGVLWFFLQLSVTSSVVPLRDLLAEHRLYLPSLGILLAAGVGLERLLERAGLAGRPLALAAVAALCWLPAAAALHRRNAAWESPRALFEDATAKAPWNARAWLSLGHALAGEGRHAEAVAVYRQALPLAAADRSMSAQLTRNLGSSLQELGRADEAEALLREAVSAGRHDADILANLAVLLLYRGRFEEAERPARGATSLSPTRPEGWNVLGEVALWRGRPGEALEHFERAERLDPGPSLRRFNRGKALAALGRRDEACALWRGVSTEGEPALARSKERAWKGLGCEERR